MKEQIERTISEVFNVDVDIELTRTDPKFGDFSSNVALKLSSVLSLPPREIAERIAAKLSADASIEEVSVAGPGFLNIRIHAAALAAQLESLWSDEYGMNNEGQGRKVVVEYPSPNMAKPYSVGHLRPGNQGWAIRNLMLASGWTVVTDDHLGDYGTPFGAWIVGFLTFSDEEKLREGGVYELGRVYVAIRQALKDEEANGDHEIADEVQRWLLRLESGDEEALAYSARFNALSLDHIHAVLSRLKISTEFEYGEAFFAPMGQHDVDTLIERGLATVNGDGSVVADLQEQGIDTPILLRKSNGAALYATTDLATINWREREWQPDRVIYVAGGEQQFHFRQLFALAHKMGVTTELIHVWFGVIDQLNEDGSREKMSSRKGVILMEELLDAAERRAQEVVEGRDVSEADVKTVALGAIKFTDFASDRRTNILFDWDRMFSLTGFSGPYVQYAAVRVNKLLRDNGSRENVDLRYDFVAEKDVLLMLLEYPRVVRAAARELEPHQIAQYVYDLARTMNRYYEATPIATDSVDPAVRTKRLELLEKVRLVFNSGLGLLGIDVPERM